MNLARTLIFFCISTLVWSQWVEPENVPCKPLSMMARNYDQLAKASLRTDIGRWDAHYYDLDLDIDVVNETLYGAVEVHLTSDIPYLESIELDLHSALSVDSVYLNGASFQHEGDILSITLDGSYSVNDIVSVGIAYHGQPQGVGFQGFLFSTQREYVDDNWVSNGIPMISTLSEPYGASTWWPCKDVPTDKADSVRIEVTTDSALTVVANGLLSSEMDHGDGTKTWVWEHKYPIATYLVSLAITKYHYWTETFYFADGDSMPLEYWMYPSTAELHSNVDRWNLTANMLKIFNEAYGEYPFANEKYGMAQFGWGGAMEHQTCSSMGSSGENTIAHELAHQWWGDLVTCSDFHHIWINEGFATYSEALYWGAKYGEEAYHKHMADKDYDYVGSIYRADTSGLFGDDGIFSYIVYGKGAWTLHMLRHILGDEQFFETLAQFRAIYSFSHASTEDFQGVAESIYGQSLEWFFDQWIYGTGKPSYLWWWLADDTNGSGTSNVSIHINQSQFKEYQLFRMPIDMYFEGANQDTTITIWNSEKDQEYTVGLNFVPLHAELDPQAWIHKEALLVSGIDDFVSQPGNFMLLKAYPNPFNGFVTIPYLVNSNFEGEIAIYDLKGAVVYTQKLSHLSTGEYEINWDARDEKSMSLPSGIYIARISSHTQISSSQKISLLK